jgi:hypothetical protein
MSRMFESRELRRRFGHEGKEENYVRGSFRLLLLNTS